MTAQTSGPGNAARVPPDAAATGGIRSPTALDPFDRAAFDLAISEEIERAGPEADQVDLVDRAMVRLLRWKAAHAGASALAPLDRDRTLAALHAQAARPHPDRRLVAACERLLLDTGDASTCLALQDRIAALPARTAMGRRAKAEVALTLLESCEEPAAGLVRSVILEALAGMPADRG